ncbi:Gfo/Idh/MocA family oxidoreductase [Actinotalea sp. M2MS4P-6]|uniref:Gfo/Idh/MocA family oxidoreductase n=1 Tax=Actinotalea sp. M2MS4P-6 TaxID=2983762 RepID=UPI0021E3DADC|nr:Gfo/Idh/MocA family oxidoreductase [Actinotalea sp. M2MS4P-6]MCV2395034.1 Gfo/Idh/MocA family oxidoreductase [Actinotalea sp. M2MS4P-6]
MHRFALVGAGFIGAVHARSLAAHPGVELRTVADPDLARARALAAGTGAAATADVATVFADPQVDAVLIASSTDTHAAVLHAAARADKAVLCEKPIDLSLATAERAVDAVRASGIPAMVDFNRRFDANHRALHDAVRAGEVGAVELVQMTSRGPSLPPLSYLAVSGGQLRDQTVHFFDLLRWITGLEPVEVYVAGAALADPAVADVPDVDTSVATLRLSNGALCQIDSARRTAYGYDERIEVAGSAGMVESGRVRTGAVSRYTTGTVTSTGIDTGWFERMAATYPAALDAFVSALDAGVAPEPSLEDGLIAQRVAEAATESLRTGRPVRIEH